jgi:hypothetical protein
MAYPTPTCAPWQPGPDFERTYPVVAVNTLADVWRCSELWSLVVELQKYLGPSSRWGCGVVAT